MKAALRTVANRLGIGVIRSDRLAQLESVESEGRELLDFVAWAHDLVNESKSQLGQDIFVLLQTRFKRNGFFVEFGATDGICHSNTYLLEKKFGWTGILAEPAPVWHTALQSNRTATIDTDCVWSETGQHLQFTIPRDATLSTIRDLHNRDYHGDARQSGRVVNVNTVSLNDLLQRHGAPFHIDYLSIDTEGSEFDILSNFDFNRYRVPIITCEHNYTADRRKISDLLTSRGYQRRFSSLSKWDDWYIQS